VSGASRPSHFRHADPGWTVGQVRDSLAGQVPHPRQTRWPHGVRQLAMTIVDSAMINGGAGTLKGVPRSSGISVVGTAARSESTKSSGIVHGERRCDRILGPVAGSWRAMPSPRHISDNWRSTGRIRSSQDAAIRSNSAVAPGRCAASGDVRARASMIRRTTSGPVEWSADGQRREMRFSRRVPRQLLACIGHCPLHHAPPFSAAVSAGLIRVAMNRPSADTATSSPTVISPAARTFRPSIDVCRAVTATRSNSGTGL